MTQIGDGSACTNGDEMCALFGNNHWLQVDCPSVTAEGESLCSGILMSLGPSYFNGTVLLFFSIFFVLYTIKKNLQGEQTLVV